MSDTAGFAITPDTEGLTGRDGFIVAEALHLAARWIDQMPDAERLVTDRRDMLHILNTAFPGWEDTFGPA